jgi:putative DNA-invertase from lambdoid prophage Rac
VLQAIKTVAIYCRVSTQDQDNDRQERDLRAYAERSGYAAIAIFTETASGAKDNRPVRKQVLQLAREKKIDAVLVTELSRWGRSTDDVRKTVSELSSYKCSLIALNGMDFNMSTPQGNLMLTLLAGFAEFERELIRERTISGLAATKARGTQLGRREGFSPIENKKAKIVAMLAAGDAIRKIADKAGVSPTTVQRIKKEVNV